MSTINSKWSQLVDESSLKAKQCSILAGMDLNIQNTNSMRGPINLSYFDNWGHSANFELSEADFAEVKQFLTSRLKDSYAEVQAEVFPPETSTPEPRVYISGEELAKSIPEHLQEVVLYRNPGAAFRAAAAALEKEHDAQTNPVTLTKIARLLLKAAKAERDYGRNL